MKIAIDCSQIIYETGVSTYVENLVKNLLLVDKENEYLLFGGSLRRLKELKEVLTGFKGRYKAKQFPIPPFLADLIWNRLHILPIEALIGKVDVFHSSDWSQPPSTSFNVTTIHDMAPLLLPELTPKKIVDAHKARFEWIRKEVDRVIVPSKTTKEDCISLGVKEEKIRIISEAVDNIFRPQVKSLIRNLKRKYRISGNYLLAVGTGARKNTESIITAFEKIRPGQELKLVITGEQDRSEEMRGVIFTGHVTKEELPIFYSGAEALVYPSLYEGFGLPILEAFSCKCPVVTSNISSMPEVAGDAAVLVDPSDIDSIAEGIKKALDNKKSLVQKGIKKVKEFSWQKAAEETLKVYNEVTG